jgi:hypothetical protein
MDSGEVNKAAVDKTTAAVERTIYTTTKLGETIRSVANKFSLHWRDIAEINLFKQEGTEKFRMRLAQMTQTMSEKQSRKRKRRSTIVILIKGKIIDRKIIVLIA